MRSASAHPALHEQDRGEDRRDDHKLAEPAAGYRRLDDEHEEQQRHDDAEHDLKDEAAS